MEESMSSKVLVAYGTKNGATVGIAEKIGEVLRGAGLEADVVAADRAGDLSQYGAVVVGSGVYIGSWRKEAATFLKANEPKLAGLPVWLFSSGPTGEGDPAALLKGWRFPEGLQPIANNIKPRDIAVFGGALDVKKLNPIEKFMLNRMKAPMGDFRDWGAITAWAGGIAEALQAQKA
jgi:menaquinone-dependent protoporphyrinogen oxidase